jgi:hypothetical protein
VILFIGLNLFSIQTRPKIDLESHSGEELAYDYDVACKVEFKNVELYQGPVTP